MREIKFRAWDKESQKIYYVVTLDTESVYGKCEVPIIRVKTGKMLDEYQPEYKTVYDYTLMQYTGLKDRNGVEIYEGDIVSNGERVRYLTGQERRFDAVGVVRYVTKQGCLVINNNDGRTKRLTAKVVKNIHVQVIGNIHENPELVGTKK